MKIESSRTAPPCLVPGTAMNSCARTHYQKIVEGNGALFGEWARWSIVGNTLVSPDRQRITPDRLQLLLLLESNARRGSRQIAAALLEGTSS